jgi:hypothetical protein
MKTRTYLFLYAALALLILTVGCMRNPANEDKAASTASTKVTYQQLAEQDNKVLTSYAILDADKGVYRIPIERAMQLISTDTGK